MENAKDPSLENLKTNWKSLNIIGIDRISAGERPMKARASSFLSVHTTVGGSRQYELN